jgi:BlaI family penicillinase repressor
MNSPSQTPSFVPLPTAAELDILAALWRIGQKGLLVRNERDRSHIYEPANPRERTQTLLAGDLLQRAFDGSATSLVLGALSAKPASAEDLETIQRMLDTFRKAKKSQ